MVSLQWNTCLVLATLVAVSLGQENTTDVCKPPSKPIFSLADIEESKQTGSTQTSGFVLPPASGNWCNNHANVIFRTNDGTCNHPNNLGAAGKPFDRLLPSAYDDGVDTPRQQDKDGQPLPSARNISDNLHPPRDVFAGFPIFLMQWGQWIAHDIVATATNTGNNTCCGPNAGCPPFFQNRKCFPIEVPLNDSTMPGVCMEFVRSLAANGSDNMPARPRQQINTVTSFHDCSQLYGSSDQTAADVREPGGFLLLNINGFLPAGPGPCIKRPNTSDYCFLAGDFRANQHPYFSAMNVLWLREHNYIVTELRKLNKKASNEEIFQTGKKMIIAIHQMVTYNVYLPIILGDDATRWKLTSLSGRSIYNPGLNPTIFMAFSTAGFRFGHSTVPPLFLVNNTFVPLRSMFNRPHLTVEHFDSIMRGMVGLGPASNSSVQSADRYFTEELTRFLFFNNNTGRGGDLVSNNNQRGRDHGIPPYVKWRSFCGLRPLSGFNDTEALGPHASELGKIYKTPNDMDLYTGMLYEQKVGNGILGPTFTCLIRIQFFRLKYGDRHFFDNSELNSGFRDDQLANIRTVLISQIICRHAKLESIQVDVFRFPSSTNPVVSCEKLKKQGLDFSLFV